MVIFYSGNGFQISSDSPSSPSLRVERDDCVADAIRVNSPKSFLKLTHYLYVIKYSTLL